MVVVRDQSLINRVSTSCALTGPTKERRELYKRENGGQLKCRYKLRRISFAAQFLKQ